MMLARWTSFGVGIWLVMAPLILGYPTVSPILHDVAWGIFICLGALVSLERPAWRFGLAAPAIWLMVASSTLDWGTITAHNQATCGLAILLLTLIPSGRLARGRSAAKMAA